MEGIRKPCMDKWDRHYQKYLTEMREVLGSVCDNSSNELCPEIKDARNKNCQTVIDKYKEASLLFFFLGFFLRINFIIYKMHYRQIIADIVYWFTGFQNIFAFSVAILKNNKKKRNQLESNGTDQK